MRDRKLLRREASGELVEHADLSDVAAGWHGGVRTAYVSNFGFDLMGGGARPRGHPNKDAATVAASRLYSRTAATTLIVSESLGQPPERHRLRQQCSEKRRDSGRTRPATNDRRSVAAVPRRRGGGGSRSGALTRNRASAPRRGRGGPGRDQPRRGLLTRACSAVTRQPAALFVCRRAEPSTNARMRDARLDHRRTSSRRHAGP